MRLRYPARCACGAECPAGAEVVMVVASGGWTVTRCPACSDTWECVRSREERKPSKPQKSPPPKPTNDTGQPIPRWWKPATRDGRCYNKCGEPVHYPSRVLCRACFLALSAKVEWLCGAKRGTP